MVAHVLPESVGEEVGHACTVIGIMFYSPNYHYFNDFVSSNLPSQTTRNTTTQ